VGLLVVPGDGWKFAGWVFLVGESVLWGLSGRLGGFLSIFLGILYGRGSFGELRAKDHVIGCLKSVHP